MELEHRREELGRNGISILKETCVPSLNPKICLGTSNVKGGGRGLYAKELIKAGEWIWRDVPGYAATSKSWAFVTALPEAARKNFLHFATCKHLAAWALKRGLLREPFACVYCMTRPVPACDPDGLHNFPCAATTIRRR